MQKYEKDLKHFTFTLDIPIRFSVNVSIEEPLVDTTSMSLRVLFDFIFAGLPKLV